MKTCCICKLDLSEDNFKKNKTKKDGLQAQCGSCQQEYRRQHYLRNQEKYLGKSAERKAEFSFWWKEYKKQFSCVECGENHPACIDFHHMNDDKYECVSRLAASCSKEKLLNEISKCIPLCANCHRIVEYGSPTGTRTQN